MNKILVIPVEIYHREINGAMILATQALMRGWQVIIGQKQQVWPHIKTLPNSVWYLKSIVPGEEKNLNLIKKNGHIISVLDVEGLVLGNGEYGVKKRYNEKTISLSDFIFYWGQESHYSKVKQYFPSVINKSYQTGSPIIDAWNFFKNNSLINNDYILISVNFAKADDEKKDIRRMYELLFAGISKEDAEESGVDGEIVMKKLSYESFSKMVPLLSNEFKDQKIIIRPHPEETLDKYINDFKEYKNIIVENHIDTSDHLLQCSAFIHFNSTMSIQSSFLGKKTIFYNDIKDEKVLKEISPITEKVSIVANNFDQLVDFIKKNTMNKIDLSKIITHKNQNLPFCSNNILETYEQNIIFTDYRKVHINSFSIIYNYFLLGLKHRLNFALSYFSIYIPFLRKRFFQFRFRYWLGKNKWTSFSLSDVKSKLLLFSQSKKFTDNLIIKKSITGCYHIKQNENKY